MSNLSIKVNLTKIAGSHFITLPGKKGPTKCIVMPVDDCNLYVGEKGVYLDLTAYQYKDQKFVDTHFIKPNLPKEVFDAMTKDQQDAIDICGGVKPIQPKQMAAAESSEFIPPVAEGAEGGSDLPF
jgi:hypothetical protein